MGHGDIVLVADAAADGAFSRVRLQSGLGRPELEGCLVRQTRRLTIPASRSRRFRITLAVRRPDRVRGGGPAAGGQPGRQRPRRGAAGAGRGGVPAKGRPRARPGGPGGQAARAHPAAAEANRRGAVRAGSLRDTAGVDRMCEHRPRSDPVGAGGVRLVAMTSTSAKGPGHRGRRFHRLPRGRRAARPGVPRGRAR